MKSEFSVGDTVRFGNGKEPYEVIAVINTGRLFTYDLRSKTRRRTCVAVVERKLNPYVDLR